MTFALVAASALSFASPAFAATNWADYSVNPDMVPFEGNVVVTLDIGTTNHITSGGGWEEYELTGGMGINTDLFLYALPETLMVQDTLVPTFSDIMLRVPENYVGDTCSVVVYLQDSAYTTFSEFSDYAFVPTATEFELSGTMSEIDVLETDYADWLMVRFVCSVSEIGDVIGVMTDSVASASTVTVSDTPHAILLAFAFVFFALFVVAFIVITAFRYVRVGS